MENSGENTPDPNLDQGMPRRALDCYNQAVDAITILYEASVSGHPGAFEVLADLADKLTTRGGDWNQMKYIKEE